MTFGRFSITFFNIRVIAKAESHHQSSNPPKRKKLRVSRNSCRFARLQVEEPLMCASLKHFRVAVYICCCRTETPAKYTARPSFIL
ncbi:hypothetical protein ARMSODRAFT_966514 [Armillaria solidipes]|uniref:Uncharacterized protein n=1 Tax=Armillaria solidipes TaxID=1076256 RepID=A0A2H3ALY8_9AGAR|nr:hypothetical protein ARMSODRAFT_966514 [Armillaria solidipes]